MSENNLVSEKEKKIALGLACAADVTAAVIQRLAGADLGNSINGNVLTREAVQMSAMKTLADKLEKRTNAM